MKRTYNCGKCGKAELPFTVTAYKASLVQHVLVHAELFKLIHALLTRSAYRLVGIHCTGTTTHRTQTTLSLTAELIDYSLIFNVKPRYSFDLETNSA